MNPVNYFNSVSSFSMLQTLIEIENEIFDLKDSILKMVKFTFLKKF